MIGNLKLQQLLYKSSKTRYIYKDQFKIKYKRIWGYNMNT